MKDAKILCLEDDVLMMKSLVSSLREIGFVGEIICCENGCEGTKKVKEKGVDYFDLVITDMLMPEVDGLAFVKYFRTLNNEVPVLMLTSITTKEVVLDCVYSGANDYIAKPVDSTLLAKKIVGVMHVV